MKELRRISFLALALLSSTLAWICLVFAGVGTGSHEHTAVALGDLLLILAVGYALLTMALSLQAFGRFEKLRGRALKISLSAAGFFAALPVGITFELGDAPAVLIALSCVLAVLPWSVPSKDPVTVGSGAGTDQDIGGKPPFC